MTLQQFRDMAKLGLKNGLINSRTEVPILDICLVDGNRNAFFWGAYRRRRICQILELTSSLDGNLEFYERYSFDGGFIVEFSIGKNGTIFIDYSRYW